ncbi:MAG: hypothetical protein AAF430_09355 [Myxococcota bacterium]
MNRMLVSVLTVAAVLCAIPLHAASLVVSTTRSFSSSAPATPDLYNLGTDGDFQSRFFSPFAVGDLAWSDGNLLIGHSSSGTIAKVDERGGLVDIILTPARGIAGLAAASNGDLFVADTSGNQLYRLSSTGSLLDLVFLNQSVSALGIDDQDRLLFAEAPSFSTRRIVTYDFDLGEISSFDANLRSLFGLAFIDGEIFATGSTGSSSSSNSMINRFDPVSGTLLGSVVGPSGVTSITAHTPEPGTALLVIGGLIALARRGRTHA